MACVRKGCRHRGGTPTGIKIARTFVSKITTSPDEAAIVKAMIGLAQDLGLNLNAEGAETREQLDLLQAWDSPNAQGLYFSEPQLAEELAAVLGQARTLVPMLNGLA